MKYAGKDYIINTVFRTNILPVISECNTACIFCSNGMNPDGVEVYRLGKIPVEEFAEIANFLSPDKKIIVGEAATRIIEGEPLLYKDIYALLRLLRERFRHTCIQITTNGLLLDEQLIDELTELGGIELNISVNSIDPLKRKLILGIAKEDDIKRKISLLKDRLKYSASCVYVPEVLAPADIEEFVAFMDENGAENVRIFLPGYTRRCKNSTGFFQIHAEVMGFVSNLRMKYKIPIMVEPPYLTDLECVVDGVVKNSPAFEAGVKYRDIILEVDNEAVSTRVDAFNRSYRARDPVLAVKRGEGTHHIQLRKPKNTSPGFIVSYDIDPDITERIDGLVRSLGAHNVLLVTSELAYDMFCRLLERSRTEYSCKAVIAKNDFFGGTIKCAGLLVIEDIIAAIRGYSGINEAPDLILLPPVMFDFKRNDLLGRNIRELEEMFEIPVRTV